MMMDMTLYKPSIWFTSITWHEISAKVDIINVAKLLKIVGEKIILSNYGSSVQELAFIFIAVLPTDKEKEETTYLKEEKKLLLYRKLPYEKVKTYSTEEVLRLMAETYLKSITELGELDTPDFDHHRLAQDVERLFVNLGWIVSKTCPPVPQNISSESVLAFLKSKAWEEKSRSSRYQVLSPPKLQPTWKDMQLYVPILADDEVDKHVVAEYKRALSAVVETVVRVYGVDSLELLMD